MRRFLFSAALLGVALFGSAFAFTPKRRLTVLGADRQPAAAALVAYRFTGYRFSLVDSILWHRPGSVLRADFQGQVELPALLTLKPGFLDRWPKHCLELVYDPRSHAAIRGGRLAESRPGDFELGADGTEIVLADRSNDPEKWEQTLEVLSAILRELLLDTADRSRSRSQAERRIVATRADREFLMAALRVELEGLMARHGASIDGQGRLWRERLSGWPPRLEQLEAWLERSTGAE